MKNSFNGERCIEILFDQSAGEIERMGAAESLMYFDDARACDALWRIVSDPSESDELRQEAAGSLGTLWLNLDIDYERLSLIPDRFLPETLHDILMKPHVLDWQRLDARTASFVRERQE